MQYKETWDVVIVGGGAAGLAAAVTAASPNCRVLLLEKCSSLGGSTALAIGSVTAAETQWQGRAGVKDSAEDFFHDLGEAIGGLGFQGRDNKNLRGAMVHDAGTSVEWLTRLGASFVGPYSERYHRVPRMHNIVPNSRSYITILKRSAIRRGVTIRTEAPVRELIVSGDRVVGVEVGALGGTRSIRANKAVILATGDYSSNTEMKTQFMSETLAQVDGINPACTGDGHLMAMAVGAVVCNMDLSIGPSLRFVCQDRPVWIESLAIFPVLAKLMTIAAKHLPKDVFRWMARRFLIAHTSPSLDLFKRGAILVNQEGKRFTNELQRSPHLSVAVSKQPGKIAFIFLDAILAQIFSVPPNVVSTAPGIAYAYFDDYRILRKDITHTGQNIFQLAEGLNMDPVILKGTIDRYNNFVIGGKDEDFGREELGQGFYRGPFHALGPLKGYFSSVEGGISVNTKCQVLTPEGRIIQGLFAAGSAGQGGLILAGHGAHIAWALVSGRIAGRNAMDEPSR